MRVLLAIAFAYAYVYAILASLVFLDRKRAPAPRVIPPGCVGP